MSYARYWQRIPVTLRAVAIGLLVTSVITIPWAAFVSLNLKYAPGLPWSPLLMAPMLWLYWQYLSGRGWPVSTAQARRMRLRAAFLSGAVWSMSIVAGIVGLGAVLAFQSVLTRLIPFPPEHSLSGVSKIPFPTLVALVVMGAIVAGVSEEAGFRGYMQGMIERRRGPVVAILVTGTVFGLAHFSHAGVGFMNLPFYISVAAVYGSLAYLTGSIMPGLVLHALGNTLEAMLQFLTAPGALANGPQKLIWESGIDAAFLMHLAWLGLWCAGAVAAYRYLASEVRLERRSVGHPSGLPRLELLG